MRYSLSGRIATCFGLLQYLIFLSFIIITCAANEIFFPLSTVHITIPKTEKYLKILEKIPITKFEVKSFEKTVPNQLYIYKLENGNDFLRINDLTGEIFIGKNFQKLIENTTFIISVRNSNKTDTNTAHMSFNIKITDDDNFCSKYDKLCFWDSVSYSVVENRNTLAFISERIGEISPSSFKQLCPQYEILYQIKNSTEYLRINDNILYTNGHFDHDSFNPGSNFQTRIQCDVMKTPNSFLYRNKRSFHVAVIDRNDNGPKLQESNQLTFILDSPHFSKDEQIGDKIIFLDQDSLAVNSHITYEIRNDSHEILKPVCNAYETDHTGIKNSVISCYLIFARDGVLRKSPYCVYLIANDDTIDSNDIKSINITICLETDLEKLHEIDRPTALALHSSTVTRNDRGRRGQNRKNPRFRSSEEALASSESGQKESLEPIIIIYPSDVYVSRLATNLSRVTQPTRMNNLINRNSIKFQITKDPTNAFNITTTAGILYVNNVTALETAVETIYQIQVSWQLKTVTLNIHLEDAQSKTCDTNNKHEMIPSCSEYENKKECIKSCGFGTDGRLCEWRQSVVNNALDPNYSTCSPDLTHCPDNKCDPLEMIGQKAERFICPQDCTPSNAIFGPHTSNGARGIYASSGTCTCDNFGKCSCFVPVVGKIKKSNKNSQNRTSSGVLPRQPEILTSTAEKQTAFECGFPCLLLIIGCPAALIFIVIGLIISRRKYMRRSKRLMGVDKMNDSRNNGDNRNSDLPLVSLENDLKFDNIDSKWEFPRVQLILDITLGEGEFGKVVKAYATEIADRPGVTTVAVKMLKTGANSAEHLALLSEFQLLQEVSHPNVIKLLGACTKEEAPLLIIEYAQYGSLKNYLRLSRKIECSGIEFTDGIESVTPKDILSFAWQICRGMAYLTEIKLVHRDLAARNVLLAQGKICKVSDFGLTRDVYEDDAYLKRSKDRVPVKWMAPESLADHVYTTKSDVWAFGVLCWELITLGSSPYPGVPPQNLYHLLKTGYRMERPENCSEEIYSIVRSCWADDAGSRPSFKYLASQWEKLLGNNAKYLELESNAVSNPIYCPDIKLSETDLTKSIQDFGEPESLEHLWRAPQMAHDIIEHSNSQEISLNDHIPPGYDMPRPLIETKTTEQKLRYENDLRFPLNNKTTKISEKFGPNHYSVPVKRGKSYMDMANKTLITDNLDNEDIEKKLSKHISFRFSSLSNLNEEATTVV